jgi:hypothetical protein
MTHVETFLRSRTLGKRGRPFGLILLTLLAIGSCLASPASGQQLTTWDNAFIVPGMASLEPGANVNGPASVSSISCPSAGNCSAGGVAVIGVFQQAFVVNEKHGSWGSAIEVPGIASLNRGSNAHGGVTFGSISCGSTGNCSAGGSYRDGASHQQAFVVNEVNGTWGKAIEVPGSAALNRGTNSPTGAVVNSISCAAAGNCSAVGDYVSSDTQYQAFVVNEKNGTWGDAIEVPGLGSLNTGGDASIISISCASAGNCSAGGGYQISNFHNQAFVVNEKNGTWRKAIEVPGIAALNRKVRASVESISCGATLNCSAVGIYDDGNSSFQAFVVNERNGTWGDAVEVPGLGSMNTGGDASINSISCASAGNCSAGGSYDESPSKFPAFVVNEKNGTWGDAVEISGTAAFSENVGTVVNSISCASTGDCHAAGLFTVRSPSQNSPYSLEAFVVNEKNGTWRRAVEYPGSAVLNSGGAASVTSISCAAAEICSVGGYYTDKTSFRQPMLGDMHS